MNRRHFVQLAGAASVGAVAETVVAAQQQRTPARTSNGARKAVMHVGTQHGDSDVILRAMAGFGVNHICSRLPSVKLDDKWSVEGLSQLRERVVPVAEEYKVKLACHPQDPGMPRGKGYQGVETVLGNVEGLKRFVSISESSYHGLNFCQGTVSEMLEKPGEQIYDVIRYFGERKKIFNVHFRNIQGKVGKFHETFPDNGDVNMIRAMRAYKEVDYDGMMMPDHA